MCKVGDKLLCKNNIGVEDRFTNGTYYVVVDLELKHGNLTCVKLKCDKNEIQIQIFPTWWFNSNPIPYDNGWYLWKHFCTKQEERKLKLKRINYLNNEL